MGDGSQKFHQENTFCHFPKPQLSPGQCQAAAPAPTEVMGLQSDSLAIDLIPALGRHTKCPSLRATCHLVRGSPRPRILLGPRGHTRLPALSLGAPPDPGGSPGHRAHRARAKGRRVQVAEWGSASATAPSGPCRSSSALRSRSRPSPGREPSYEEAINIC